MKKSKIQKIIDFLLESPKRSFIKFYSIFLRTKIINKKNLPKDGPAIIAVNHITGSDPILIMASLKKKMTFLGDSKLFTTKLTSFFFSKITGTIPVFKEDFFKNTKVFKDLFGRIKTEKMLLGVFPEGKLNKKDKLDDLFKGTAYISYKTCLPVIPVYISNVFKGPSKKSWFGRNSVAEGLITIFINFFKRVHIHIGNPIDPTAENVVDDFKHLGKRENYKDSLEDINRALKEEFIRLEEQSSNESGYSVDF
jgi:1-acyl-sn-glycerol-3-phosphate acyltransferase